MINSYYIYTEWKRVVCNKKRYTQSFLVTFVRFNFVLHPPKFLSELLGKSGNECYINWPVCERRRNKKKTCGGSLVSSRQQADGQRGDSWRL